MYNRYQCIPHNEGQRGGLTTPSGFLWPSIKNIRNIRNKHIQPKENLVDPIGKRSETREDLWTIIGKKGGWIVNFVVELYEMDEELDGSITGSVDKVGVL